MNGQGFTEPRYFAVYLKMSLKAKKRLTHLTETGYAEIKDALGFLETTIIFEVLTDGNKRNGIRT